MKRFTRALAAWAWGMVGGCLGGGLASLGSWLTTNGLNAMTPMVGTIPAQLQFDAMLRPQIVFGVTSGGTLRTQ